MQVSAVIIILAVGFVISATLIWMRKPPARQQSVKSVPLLKAQRVYARDLQMIVTGHGTVQPKVEVQIVPQVSGRVIKCHEDFVNGGFFKAGQQLISIDPRDYALAVESAEAAVARSQVQLDQELAEADVARRQWDLLNPDTEPASPLVLREPQIRHARAQLKASNAQLATAMLNLERTVISMPFDGRVAAESVDRGRYLAAGQPVATVYGTDVVEIVVPLEDKELAWFDVPLGYVDGSNTPPVNTGSKAFVSADFAGRKHIWNGKIVRTHGRIDPASRMVNVVAEVAEPFKLSDHQPPLVPGMFVEIEIKGKLLKNIIRVPRYAVHNPNHLWVVNENRLHIQQVQIVRYDKDYAYVISGINDGDIIVTSPLDTVTDRMEIRISLTDLTDTQEAKNE